MHLAWAVADDERGSGVGLGLLDGLEGLRGLGAHGDLRHVHVAVADGNLGQGLLLDVLAGGRELGNLADVGSLGCLTAGVGVDLGVEDEHVDVAAGSQDVVESAVADVVGPAVAAEDPEGLLGEVLGVLEDGLCVGAAGLGDGGEDCLERLGGVLAGLGVVHGVEPGVGHGGELSVGALVGEHVLGVLDELGANGFVAKLHAHAELGVVLEERVAPSRAVPVLVRGVRRGGRGVTPDGGAAGGVGDEHAVAEELGHKASVRSLGAAGAGAGELEQRGLELAALERVVDSLGLLGDVLDAVVEDLLLVELALGGNHRDGAGLALADAHAAAHAVERGDGQRVLVEALGLAGLDGSKLDGRGRSGDLGLVELVGADGGVGAHEGAAVALHALLGVPLGNHDGYAALLEGGGAQLELAVGAVGEGGDGK